jgi:hypothetical protein
MWYSFFADSDKLLTIAVTSAFTGTCSSIASYFLMKYLVKHFEEVLEAKRWRLSRRKSKTN